VSPSPDYRAGPALLLFHDGRPEPRTGTGARPWRVDDSMGTATQCSFCGQPASIPGEPVASCASCAATLGRCLGLMDENSRGRLWDLKASTDSCGHAEADEAFFRTRYGASPEECLRNAIGRGIEFRLTSLGFLAAGLADVGNRSAGLRAASVFLTSCINESLLSNQLLKAAAQSCLEALFRPGFFKAEQMGALREELAVAR
jgi:hypothetical protein